MEVHEANALVRYLEFNFIKYIEEFEQHIDDPNIQASMYNRAYDILNDLNQTIKVNIIADTIAKQNQNNR
jgi:hypothetical protein